MASAQIGSTYEPNKFTIILMTFNPLVLRTSIPEQRLQQGILPRFSLSNVNSISVSSSAAGSTRSRSATDEAWRVPAVLDTPHKLPLVVYCRGSVMNVSSVSSSIQSRLCCVCVPLFIRSLLECVSEWDRPQHAFFSWTQPCWFVI